LISFIVGVAFSIAAHLQLVKNANQNVKKLRNTASKLGLRQPQSNEELKASNWVENQTKARIFTMPLWIANKANNFSLDLLAQPSQNDVEVEAELAQKAKPSSSSPKVDGTLVYPNRCESDIFFAVALNDGDLIRELLEISPGSENARDNNGKTPLFFALEGGRGCLYQMARMHETIKLLLRRGADANAACNAGNSLLHIAAVHGPYSATRLKLLINSGASIEQGDRTGRRALHIAVETFSEKYSDSAIKQLILWGADAGSIDQNGDTPVHYAAALGKPKILNRLLLSGPLLSGRAKTIARIKNKNGLTPIEVATGKWNKTILMPFSSLESIAKVCETWSKKILTISNPKLRLIHAKP